MEGVITQMKIRDRKLTDQHLALAVDKNLDLVPSNYLWKVTKAIVFTSVTGGLNVKEQSQYCYWDKDFLEVC